MSVPLQRILRRGRLQPARDCTADVALGKGGFTFFDVCLEGIGALCRIEFLTGQLAGVVLQLSYGLRGWWCTVRKRGLTERGRIRFCWSHNWISDLSRCKLSKVSDLARILAFLFFLRRFKSIERKWKSEQERLTIPSWVSTWRRKVETIGKGGDFLGESLELWLFNVHISLPSTGTVVLSLRKKERGMREKRSREGRWCVGKETILLRQC